MWILTIKINGYPRQVALMCGTVGGLLGRDDKGRIHAFSHSEILGSYFDRTKTIFMPDLERYLPTQYK